jgi:hypothetical protein
MSMRSRLRSSHIFAQLRRQRRKLLNCRSRCDAKDLVPLRQVRHFDITTTKAYSRPRILHESIHVCQETAPQHANQRERSCQYAALAKVHVWLGKSCVRELLPVQSIRQLEQDKSAVERASSDTWDEFLPLTAARATADFLTPTINLDPNTAIVCQVSPIGTTERVVRSYMGCALPQILLPRFTDSVGLQRDVEEFSRI